MIRKELTITEAAAAIARGEMAAEAYAESLLERCRGAAHLNAFIFQDPAAVWDAAKRADAQVAAGAALGPLHGVPLAIKDNIDIAGMATTGGTPGLKANRPKQDAPVLRKLLDAGALVLGKTNMHELAFGITGNNAAFGAAANPYDPERIAGGSSGGTGVAVAARMAPGGIGTDTGGSIRIPAAFCGVVGFRPSMRRWSQEGIVPLSHTRDTAGPLARSVADCALLDAVVAGGAPTLEAVSLKGMRLGVPRGYFWEELDAETGVLLEEALARFRAAGVVLVEGEIKDVGPHDRAAGFAIVVHEVVTDLTNYMAGHGIAGDLTELVAQIASPDVKAILEGAIGTGAVPAAAYEDAMKLHRPALQESYRRYFRDDNLSACLIPTTPAPAAKIGEDRTMPINGKPVPTFPTYIRNTDPGSVADLPGLSLPAGMTAAGLPVGIELDGPTGSDRRLLAIGAALEALLPKPPTPPGLA